MVQNARSASLTAHSTTCTTQNCNTCIGHGVPFTHLLNQTVSIHGRTPVQIQLTHDQDGYNTELARVSFDLSFPDLPSRTVSVIPDDYGKVDIVQACFKYFSGPFIAVIKERDQTKTIRVPFQDAADIGKKLVCTSDGLVKLESLPIEEEGNSCSATSAHVQSPDSQTAARSRKTLAGKEHKPEQVKGQGRQPKFVPKRTRPPPSTSVRPPRCNPCSCLFLLASPLVFILFAMGLLLHCGGPDLPEALWIAGKHRLRNTQFQDAICHLPYPQLRSFFDCASGPSTVLDHLDEPLLRISNAEHRKICSKMAPFLFYRKAETMVDGIQKAREHKKKAYELLAYNRKLGNDIMPNLHMSVLPGQENILNQLKNASTFMDDVFE